MAVIFTSVAQKNWQNHKIGNLTGFSKLSPVKLTSY